MIRLLLAFFRPLRSISASLARIADALERAHPARRGPSTAATYVPYDEEGSLLEQTRRTAYAERLGRPLADDEDVPLGFDHEDRLQAKATALGQTKSQNA